MLKISLYLDEVDTLDDVDIDDDVETELDVDTLAKRAQGYHFIFLRFSSLIKKSCLNDNKVNSVFISYSWVLKPNITTGVWQKKNHYYLEEVDTLDDVDIDDDVDTELEEETLKKSAELPLYNKW